MEQKSYYIDTHLLQLQPPQRDPFRSRHGAPRHALFRQRHDPCNLKTGKRTDEFTFAFSTAYTLVILLPNHAQSTSSVEIST